MVEIELKLTGTPAVLAQVLTLPALQPLLTGTAHSQPLLSRYYDTPALALRRHGMALRLRQTPQGWVQTLKSRGSLEAGIAVRQELESPSDGHTLDFSGIGDEALRTFLQSPEVGPCLAPCFVTDFERIAQRLDCPDGSVVELDLDRGEVRSGSRRAPIAEIELELVTGRRDALTDLAALLQEHLPLAPSTLSKAERGYQLLTAGTKEGIEWT